MNQPTKGKGKYRRRAIFGAAITFLLLLATMVIALALDGKETYFKAYYLNILPTLTLIWTIIQGHKSLKYD